MKKVILFGAGSYLSKYIDMLNNVYDIMFICDNDERRWNTYFEFGGGKKIKIISPDILKENYKNVEVIITSSFEEEILNQLKRLGCNANTLYKFSENEKYIHRKMLKDFIEQDLINGFGSMKHIELDKQIMNIYNGWNNHFNTRKIVLDTLNFCDLKGKKVLDYGFGCGTLVLNLLLNNIDAYGVEIDADKTKFLFKKIDELNYPQDYKKHFVVYDGEKISFDDDEFDVVFCDYVLEHVYDCEKSIKEMYRVCKPGGYIHIACPNYDSSFEEHYLIDFEKPLRGNKEEFKRFIIQKGGNAELIDSLNFINLEDVISILNKLGDIEIINLNTENKLKGINLLVKKMA